MDPVVADKCLSTLGIGDKDEIHWPFRRGEDMCGLVGLFVRGNKPHVPRRDLDEVRHVVWSRIAAEFHGVSSQTGRIKTT